MENHGILNWRKWSTVRKAQVIGAVTGALITVGTPMLLIGCGMAGAGSSDSLLLRFYTLVLSPAYNIFQLLRWSWRGDISTALIPWLLAILINSFLLFMGGTAVGWLLNKFRNKQQ